jgi:enoyl-CoA hydratase
VDRRRFVLAAAPVLSLPPLLAAAPASSRADGRGAQAGESPTALAAPATSAEHRIADIPKSVSATLTIERRKQIVLIGINRPQMLNEIDPDTFYALATAYYDFDNDLTLRAAVLFGHGENFCRGIDVEAFSALAKAGKSFKLNETQLDPLGRAKKLSKPLVAVAHGDTWNMGHELQLFADVRVVSKDVRYRHTENAHGRVPGVALVRTKIPPAWADKLR